MPNLPAQGTTMVIIIRNNYKQQVTIRNENERKRVHTRSGSWEVADPTPAGWWPTLQVLELDLDGQSGLSVSIVVRLFEFIKNHWLSNSEFLSLFQNQRITCSNSFKKELESKELPPSSKALSKPLNIKSTHNELVVLWPAEELWLYTRTGSLILFESWLWILITVLITVGVSSLFLVTTQDSLVCCNCFTNNSIGIWQSKANCRQRLKSWLQGSRPNHTRFPDTHGQQNVNLKKPEKCDETIVLAMLGLLWTSCCSLWLNWSDHVLLERQWDDDDVFFKTFSFAKAEVTHYGTREWKQHFNQCWAAIRNSHRAPKVIKAVLKIHNCKHLKDLVFFVSNRNSQFIRKKNQTTDGKIKLPLHCWFFHVSCWFV